MTLTDTTAGRTRSMSLANEGAGCDVKSSIWTGPAAAGSKPDNVTAPMMKTEAKIGAAADFEQPSPEGFG